MGDTLTCVYSCNTMFVSNLSSIVSTILHPQEYTDSESQEESSDTLVRVLFEEGSRDKGS